MITRESPAFEQIPTALFFDGALTALDVRIYGMLCVYTKIQLSEKEAESRVCDLLQICSKEYHDALDRLESGGWIHTFLSDAGKMSLTLYGEKRKDYIDLEYTYGDGF